MGWLTALCVSMDDTALMLQVAATYVFYQSVNHWRRQPGSQRRIVYNSCITTWTKLCTKHAADVPVFGAIARCPGRSPDYADHGRRRLLPDAESDDGCRNVAALYLPCSISGPSASPPPTIADWYDVSERYRDSPRYIYLGAVPTHGYLPHVLYVWF